MIVFLGPADSGGYCPPFRFKVQLSSADWLAVMPQWRLSSGFCMSTAAPATCWRHLCPSVSNRAFREFSFRWCLWSATILPWGVHKPAPPGKPVQIYELVLTLALFAFLLRQTSRLVPRRRVVSDIHYRLFNNTFSFRIPALSTDTLYFLGLTLVQWLCIAKRDYILVISYYRQHKYVSALLVATFTYVQRRKPMSQDNGANKEDCPKLLLKKRLDR